MIYHIYWGTSGTSGLYLDEIFQVLHKLGYKQEVFVSHYYPFPYGRKIFFKYSDVGHSRYKGKSRRLIQFLEICRAFIMIIVYAAFQKPTIINYSHIGKSYYFIYLFLLALKFVSGSKIIITCHDVMPHGYEGNKMSIRKKIFKIGDFLIVHNNSSVKTLERLFGIKGQKILMHRFPIMDLKKMNSSSVNKLILEKNIDFLFIGHLRKDKGIELLLETWPIFHEIEPDANLYVCGQKLNGVSFDENKLSKLNVHFNLKFINDKEFSEYILRARTVVLPYNSGTNSGIISTVLSLNANVLTSNIPMFEENELVCNEDMFISEDKDSLIELLIRKYHQKENSLSRLDDYREKFNNEVKEVYNIIQHNSKD